MASAATHLGAIAATLPRAGSGIGTMGTLHASHAMAVDAVMVINNTLHFERVPGLKVENWTQGH